MSEDRTKVIQTVVTLEEWLEIHQFKYENSTSITELTREAVLKFIRPITKNLPIGESNESRSRR